MYFLVWNMSQKDLCLHDIVWQQDRVFLDLMTLKSNHFEQQKFECVNAGKH